MGDSNYYLFKHFFPLNTFLGLEKFQRIKAENFRISTHISTPLNEHIGTSLHGRIDTPPVPKNFVLSQNDR